MRSRFVLLGVVAALVLLIVLGGRDLVDEPVEGDGVARTQETDDPSDLRAHEATVDAADAHLRGSSEEEAASYLGGRSLLEGRVVDAGTGQGIQGACVIGFAADGTTRLCWTGPGGVFVLRRLDPGSWSLFVWHRLYLSAGLQALLEGEKPGPGWEVAQVTVPEGGGRLPERVLALRPGRVIQGQVVDTAGQPVSGARIRLHEGTWRKLLEKRLDTSISGWEKYVPLATDPAGRFRIACLPPAFGALHLGASVPGSVCRWSDPIPLDAGLPAHLLTLTIVPGATLTGRVVTPDGSGAHPVIVYTSVATDRAWEEAWVLAPVDRVETEADGSWSLSGLPPGPVELVTSWVRPGLHGSDTSLEPLDAGEVRRDVTLRVPPRHVLRGRFVDAAGNPLAEERLELRPDALETLDDVGDTDTTDEDGRFVFTTLHRGPFAVVQLLPGDGERVLARGLIAPFEELALVGRGIERTCFEVRVVDPNGRPVPRFRSIVLPARPDGGMDDTRWLRDTARGIDGRAAHRAVGRPPFWLRLSGARGADGEALPLGQVRQRVETVTEGGVVEVTLPWADEVSGRILGPDGAPVPGVRVLLQGKDDESWRDLASLLTGSDGSFSHRVGAWVDDRLRIEIRVPPGWTMPYGRGVTPGRRMRTIRLEPGGAVAGRLVTPGPLPRGADGAPLEVIVLVPDADGGSQRARHVPVDEDGRWRLEGVPLGRDLTVRMSSHVLRLIGFQPPEAQERVRAGDLEVELRLLPGLTLAGRVQEEHGAVPSRGFVLIAAPVGATDQPGAVGRVSTEDGRFELTGLSAGTWRLTLLDLSNRVGHVMGEHRPGAEDLRLVLPACGTLRLTVTGEFAEGAWDVDVWVAGATTRRASGHFEQGPSLTLEGVPANGEYVVVATSWEGYVATAGGVRVGRPAALRSAEVEHLSGRVHGAAKPDDLEGELYAVREDAVFHLPVVDEDGWFEALRGVAPGCYELRWVAPDGTTTVVARGVEAGRDDLEIEVP